MRPPKEKLHMDSQQKLALAVALITGFMAPFMSSAMNLSVTAIGAEFSAPAPVSTWIVNSYTLAIAAFSICMGRIADIRGKRRMILLGTALYGVFGVVCIFAPNILVLIAGRFCMGISAAIMLSSNVPLMLLYFPPQIKGRMLGLTVSSVYVGLALGPTIGGILNDLLSWHAIFIFSVIVSIVAVILTLRLADDTVTESGEALDNKGNALFIASILLCMIGLSELNQQPWAWLALVIGAALLVVFVIVEWRTPSPVMQVRLFASNIGYAFSNLANLLNFGATYAIGYVMAIYLQNVQGLDAGIAGLLVIVQPIMQTLVSPLAGRLSDRFSPYVLSSVGLLVVTGGLVAMCFVHVGTSLGTVVLGFALIGCGVGIFSSPNNNAILTCAGRDHYSEANATISTMRGIGQSISMALTSFLLSFELGDVVFSQADPVLLSDGIHLIVIACTIISVFSAVISLCRGREKRDD